MFINCAVPTNHMTCDNNIETAKLIKFNPGRVRSSLNIQYVSNKMKINSIEILKQIRVRILNG